MLEDKLLILRFKHGSQDALRRIYEKYRIYLLRLATALLYDNSVAEDVVHDVFLRFAQSEDKLKLQGSLKWYMATCVANSARDRIRAKQRRPIGLEKAEAICSDVKGPQSSAICNEELQLLSLAMEQLPYEQREVIILHAKGGIKFRQIAEFQDVSIKTVQSRYRYGLDKLRLILDGEMKK